jgi:hypothetical protein
LNGYDDLFKQALSYFPIPNLLNLIRNHVKLQPSFFRGEETRLPYRVVIAGHKAVSTRSFTSTFES